MRYAVLRSIDDPALDVCGIITERDDGTARVAWPNEFYGGLKVEFSTFESALETLHRSFLVSDVAGGETR